MIFSAGIGVVVEPLFRLLQPWRTIPGCLFILSFLGAFFLDWWKEHAQLLIYLWIALIAVHFILLSRAEKRRGRVKRRRSIGVFSVIFLAVCGIVLGILSIFRRKKSEPQPEGARWAAVKEEALRWFGHAKTVILSTIPSGCFFLILGLVVAGVACLVPILFGVLKPQLQKTGWGSVGLAVWLFVVLGTGSLLWGILSGFARGIRRVIVEGGEVERLYGAVRGQVTKALAESTAAARIGAGVQAGITLTQNQANRLLDRVADEANPADSQTKGARAWLARKLKRMVVDRVACGLIDEASDVDRAGNLRIDPQRMENAGLEVIKGHAARLATSFVDGPRILVAVATLVLAALPFVLIARFVSA